MRYGKLLEALRKLGVDEVARLGKEGETCVYLSKPEYVMFPRIDGPIIPVYLGKGTDRDLVTEEVKAILRRFKLDEKQIAE